MAAIVDRDSIAPVVRPERRAPHLRCSQEINTTHGCVPSGFWQNEAKFLNKISQQSSHICGPEHGRHHGADPLGWRAVLAAHEAAWDARGAFPWRIRGAENRRAPGMYCLSIPMLCGSRTNTNSGSGEALLSIPALTKL
jgi:hypothetical protein